MDAQKVFALPAEPVSTLGASVAVTVGAGKAAARFDHPNVGLSFEASDLADERWDPAKSTVDELIGALDHPSLRFGGNSVDRRVWWTSSDEPAPDWAEATVRPADLARLATLVKKIRATVTLVVDLGHNDPDRAADYVFHAHRALGKRLVGVSIGNEPNGYALASQPQYRIRPDGWSPAAFIAEARAYRKAIHARVPDMGIVGPGTFSAPWWRAFGDARFPNTVALSQHWYPLWACDRDEDPRAAPTVVNLVSPWLHDRARLVLGAGARTAKRYGQPLWLEETGPTSCVGTNDTSRTHAQALWTADFTLHAATLGVRRLNYHGMLDACRGGAPMSPLCDIGPLGSRSPVLRGQANYLALLQLGRLREGRLARASVSGSDRVYSYAVSDADGVDVVVVNLNDPAETGASPLRLEVPSGLRATHASLLYADELGVRNGTRLIPWSRLDQAPDAVGAGSVLVVRYAKG